MRKSIAWQLAHEEGIGLCPCSLRHVLNRPGFEGKKKARKELCCPLGRTSFGLGGVGILLPQDGKILARQACSGEG